ncbi:MAG: uncharacterized protein A8A55_1808 [Amphiamblys sp. WSBS2006]|nr:MAG: uncharacterized protein A8A55_1808 [Amphiamblys sp. WSBS2006]
MDCDDAFLGALLKRLTKVETRLRKKLKEEAPKTQAPSSPEQLPENDTSLSFPSTPSDGAQCGSEAEVVELGSLSSFPDITTDGLLGDNTEETQTDTKEKKRLHSPEKTYLRDLFDTQADADGDHGEDAFDELSSFMTEESGNLSSEAGEASTDIYRQSLLTQNEQMFKTSKNTFGRKKMFKTDFLDKYTK